MRVRLADVHHVAVDLDAHAVGVYGPRGVLDGFQVHTRSVAARDHVVAAILLPISTAWFDTQDGASQPYRRRAAVGACARVDITRFVPSFRCRRAGSWAIWTMEEPPQAEPVVPPEGPAARQTNCRSSLTIRFRSLAIWGDGVRLAVPPASPLEIFPYPE
jgi:hypothetical protein